MDSHTAVHPLRHPIELAITLPLRRDPEPGRIGGTLLETTALVWNNGAVSPACTGSTPHYGGIFRVADLDATAFPRSSPAITLGVTWNTATRRRPPSAVGTYRGNDGFPTNRRPRADGDPESSGRQPPGDHPRRPDRPAVVRHRSHRRPVPRRRGPHRPDQHPRPRQQQPRRPGDDRRLRRRRPARDRRRRRPELLGLRSQPHRRGRRPPSARPRPPPARPTPLDPGHPGHLVQLPRSSVFDFGATASRVIYPTVLPRVYAASRRRPLEIANSRGTIHTRWGRRRTATATPKS